MTLMDIHTMRAGTRARVVRVEGVSALRLMEMGLIPGTLVALQKIAPFGDPMEIALDGYRLMLRKEDAEKITVVTDAYP